VKLLLDENLPRSLVGSFPECLSGSTHVAFLDLLSASDDEIWRFAANEGFTIATKDRDFADRAIVFGHPPKVVWLRLGNCTVEELHELIEGSTGLILSFIESEFGLLVLPSGLRAG
jgi:predicted nuclease of predicted toxin-antitoxin system